MSSNLNILNNVNYGGVIILVYGYFSYSGVKNSYFIGKIMDAKEYVCILNENLNQSTETIGLDTYIYFSKTMTLNKHFVLLGIILKHKISEF